MKEEFKRSDETLCTAFADWCNENSETVINNLLDEVSPIANDFLHMLLFEKIEERDETYSVEDIAKTLAYGVALGYFMKECGEDFIQMDEQNDSQGVYVPYQFLSQSADDLVGGKFRKDLFT
ncbi:MAG: hypothetical protein GY861_10405 [bacterium]|nr:hypothetical protein [bacterium]